MSKETCKQHVYIHIITQVCTCAQSSGYDEYTCIYLCVCGWCVYSTCAMYSYNDLQSDALKDAEYSYATEVPGSSELQTIEVCSKSRV